MRKLIISLVLVVLTISINAQSWQWSRSAGGSNNDYAQSIAKDSNGNVYITGYFTSSSIQFGNTPSLNNINNNNIYLTKYDAFGNALWSTKNSIGQGIYQFPSSSCITIDKSNNVYIVGIFASQTIQFGNTPVLTLTSNSASYTGDIFIVKYDSSGTALWARSVEGSCSDLPMAITTDANGNLYIAGEFISQTIQFGNTPALTNSGNYDYGCYNAVDIFIAKYDSSGNALWAKNAGGSSGHDYVYGVAVDSVSNVYITGEFTSSSIQFGNTPVLTNTGGFGSYNMYITKYDSLGTALWAKNIGSNAVAYDIIADKNNNIYLTGYFKNLTIQFGNTPVLTNLGSYGIPDIFIAKYDSSGTSLWAKSAGGNSYDQAFSIDIDTSNNIYITGRSGSSLLQFGNTPALTLNTNNTNNYYLFIAKYDSLGTALWAVKGGGDSESNSITTDINGNTYIAGRFLSNSIQFGNNTVLTNNGLFDIFIAKYGYNASVAATSATATLSTICSGSTTTLGLTGGSLDSNANWNWYTGSCGGTYVISGVLPVISPTVTYTYWVRAEGASNTTTCVSVTVTVNPTYTITNNPTINTGQSYFAGGAYQTTTGTYYDSLLTTFGCDSIIITNLTVNTTSISTETTEYKDIDIFPNPTNSSFTINLTESNAMLKIYNLSGQLLKEQNLKGNENTIDIKDLLKGIYLIEVISDKNIYYSKIIKE